MKFGIQIDAQDAIQKIGELSSKVDQLDRQLRRLDVKVRAPSQASLKSQLDTLKIPQLSAELKLKVPTQKELKSQLGMIKVPDIGMGLKLKASKKDLQAQLDKIVGAGLSVKTNINGGGKPGTIPGNASLIASINALNKSLQVLSKFAPVPKTQKEIDAYAKRVDASLKNADTRRDELSLRESYSDETKLLKAQQAMRNEMELMGDKWSTDGSFFEELMRSVGGRILRQSPVTEALARSSKQWKFGREFDREAKETAAFKNTGKSEMKDLTAAEKAAVTTELTASGTIKSIASAANIFSTAIGGVTAVATKLGESFVKLGKESISAYEGVQTLQTQLGVVYGSQVEAGSAFAGIEAYAKKSPFGVETMTSQAVLLKQSGVYSSELMDMMQRIGDISSGNNEKMRSISETYARVLASTTVTARDMRQLANAGVPIYREMAKQLGVGQNQVRSMLQSGKVKSTDLTAVIKNLTDEGGAFYGATEVGAKTLSAKRQNLDDAREMAAAAFGRYITEFGSVREGDAQKSFYGKAISFIDGFYNGLEHTLNETNYRKADKRDSNIMDEMASLSARLQEERSRNGDSEVVRLLEDALDTYMRQNASVVEDWIANGELMYQERLSEFAGKAVISDDLYSQYMYEPGMLSADLYNTLYGFQVRDGLLSQSAYDKAISDLDGGGWGQAHQFALLTEKLESGFTVLDKIINDQYGSVGLRQSAQIRWENGTLGKAYEQREEYERNASLRARLDEADRRYLRGDSYSFAEASVAELSDAFSLLASDAERLDLSLAGLSDDGKTLSSEGKDEAALALERLMMLYGSVGNSASQSGLSISEYIGEENSAAISSLFVVLKDISRAGVGDRIDSLSLRLATLFNTLEEGLSSSGAKGAQETLEAMQKVMTRGGLSSAGKDKLNKRLTPSLWAQVLSGTTGIDATRITLDGRGAAMSAYRNNLSQRSLFSDVASALLSSGVSFGDVTSGLRRTGTGYDGTSLYDWNGGMGAVEQMASGVSATTQKALIDAYQSQIDTLNKLEVAGLATVDSWGELEYISQGLGSAFNVTAERLSDGTYRFTDETIRAVEEMKRALSAKKLTEEISNVFKTARESLSSENRENVIKTLSLEGVFGGAGLTGAQLEKSGAYIYDAMSTAIAKENLGELVLANAKNNGSLERLVSMYNSMTGGGKTYTAGGGKKEIAYSYTPQQIDELNNSIEQMAKERYLSAIRNGAGVASQSYTEKDAIKSVVQDFLDGKISVVIGGKSLTSDLKPGSYTTDGNGKFLSARGYATTYTQEKTDLTGADIQELVELYKADELSFNEIQALSEIILDIGGNSRNAMAELVEGFTALTESTLGLAKAQESVATDAIIDKILANRFGIGEESGTTIADVDSYSSHYRLGLGGRAARLGALGLNTSVDEAWAYNQLYEGLGETRQVQLRADYIKARGYDDKLLKLRDKTDSEGNPKYDVEYIDSILSGLNSGDIDLMRDSTDEIFRNLQQIGAISPFDASVEGMYSFIAATEAGKQSLNELQESMYGLMENTALNGLSTTFGTLGKHAYTVSKGVQTSAEAEEEFANNLKKSAAAMLESMGPMMTQAGFSLIKEGGAHNIAMGLALIAAGGVANFLGGYLNAAADDTDENDTDDEYERLQRMKDSLADLLKQARDDAAYYETTLRSRRAIATNEGLSATAVHDMILTPQGNFSTDPDDYIIASKNPASLGGGAMPNISVNVINTGNAELNVESSRSRRTADGFELDVIVNGIVKGAMADGEYDDILAGAQERQKGYAVSA